MNGIQDRPPSYALPIGEFQEVNVPVWDTVAKVASVVAYPLRILSWIWSCCGQKKSHKMEPSGPEGHLVLGSYPELKALNFDLLQFLNDVNEKYGKESGICRIKLGTRIFHIVTNPKLIKEILDNPKAFVRGSSLKIWQEKFSPEGLSEGPKTVEWRRQAVNAIGPSALPRYFEEMKKVSREWVLRLSSCLENEEGIDLMYEAERASLAMVGETLLKNDSLQDPKNPFGLRPEDDQLCSKFLESFHIIFENLSVRMMSALANVPFVGDSIYSRIYSDEEKALTDAKEDLKKIMEPIFRSILEGQIDPGSHIYKLLVIFGIDIKNPDYADLLEKCLGFLQASFETASKAIGWTLYHLARDLPLQKRLRGELFALFGGKIPENLDELKKAVLLQQVMEEALRLWTPFPVLLRDVKDPNSFSEYKVDKGDTFLISPFLAQRREEAWENPAEFIPERFKEESNPQENMLHDSWQIANAVYGTFLGGIHRCPGRHFAKQEILLLIANFIQNYNIELANREAEAARVKFCITLQPKEKIVIRLSPAEF